MNSSSNYIISYFPGVWAGRWWTERLLYGLIMKGRRGACKMWGPVVVGTTLLPRHCDSIATTSHQTWHRRCLLWPAWTVHDFNCSPRCSLFNRAIPPRPFFLRSSNDVCILVTTFSNLTLLNWSIKTQYTKLYQALHMGNASRCVRSKIVGIVLTLL